MSASNPNPNGAGQPVTSVTTADLGATPSTPSSDPVYVHGEPIPTNKVPEAVANLQSGQATEPATGSGLEGEETVWAGRYSMWNFTGRIAVMVLFTIIVAGMAIQGSRRPETRYLWSLSKLTGVVLGLLWIYLLFRMIRAWYSHFYRLTTRRLFVSGGIVQRRRAMLELLRVNDVTMRQNSLLERWIGLGTVIVTSSEKNLPNFVLLGVRDPKAVLDLIWHHARTERDLHSVKVDHV